MSPKHPILMVDDDATDRMLAERCYRKVDSPRAFITLDGGAALIEYMESAATGEKPVPALILLDVNMPGMDGFTTLQEIRSRNEFAEVPVITMFTHSDRPSDESKVLSMGANGFQTKPDNIAMYVEFLTGLESVISP